MKQTNNKKTVAKEDVYELLRKKHDQTDWSSQKSIREYNEYARKLYGWG